MGQMGRVARLILRRPASRPARREITLMPPKIRRHRPILLMTTTVAFLLASASTPVSADPATPPILPLRGPQVIGQLLIPFFGQALDVSRPGTYRLFGPTEVTGTSGVALGVFGTPEPLLIVTAGSGNDRFTRGWVAERASRRCPSTSASRTFRPFTGHFGAGPAILRERFGEIARHHRSIEEAREALPEFARESARLTSPAILVRSEMVGMRRDGIP